MSAAARRTIAAQCLASWYTVASLGGEAAWNQRRQTKCSDHRHWSIRPLRLFRASRIRTALKEEKTSTFFFDTKHLIKYFCCYFNQSFAENGLLFGINGWKKNKFCCQQSASCPFFSLCLLEVGKKDLCALCSQLLMSADAALHCAFFCKLYY